MFLELLTSDTLLRHPDERPGQDGQQVPLKMKKRKFDVEATSNQIVWKQKTFEMQNSNG